MSIRTATGTVISGGGRVSNQRVRLPGFAYPVGGQAGRFALGETTVEYLVIAGGGGGGFGSCWFCRLVVGGCWWVSHKLHFFCSNPLS
jgi:hypothetical protein